MKRVISFNISRQPKGGLLAFLLAVVTRAKDDPAIAALCNQPLQNLIAAYYLLEEIAQRHRMNLLTPEVQAADEWRDVNLTNVRAAVRTQLKNPDPAKRQAAELLWKITEELGRVHDMQYDVESGMLTTYCLDMLQNHRAELELLGIVEQVEALQQANNDFIKLLSDRTETMMGFERGEFTAARKAAIDAYRDFVLVINAKVAENQGAQLIPFIEYLNAEIERQRIALRQGVRTPTAEPGDIPTPTPPAGDNKPDNKPSDKPNETPNETPSEGGNTGENTGNENTGGTPPEQENPNQPPPPTGGGESGFDW